MRPPRRAHPAIAAALVGLVVLVGCQSDPEPRFADPTESPSSATESSSESATPDPTPTVDSNETAEEFVRRFQAEAFAMQSSGDTATYRSLFRGCVSCESFADRVDDVYDGGGSVTTSGGEITALKLVGRKGGVRIFEYTLQSTAVVIRDAQGGVVQRYPAVTERYQTNVEREGSEWVITAGVLLTS